MSVKEADGPNRLNVAYMRVPEAKSEWAAHTYAIHAVARIGVWEKACRSLHASATVLLASLVLCSVSSAAPSVEVEQYQVEAAFLYHFIQLVEWPAESDQQAIVVCTVGTDPFQGDLEETMNNKTVHSRPIQVRHVNRAEALRGCQVVFLNGDNRALAQQALSLLKNSPVLTVGDGDTFLQDGGMIRFCLESNRVRFEINLRAAEQARLKISSRLLLLAKNVMATGRND